MGTAQLHSAIGVFLWAVWDQKTFTEPDSLWLTQGGTKCSAGYFGGGRIREVDFEIATMKVCSIIGERVLIVTEEDSHIKKKM